MRSQDARVAFPWIQKAVLVVTAVIATPAVASAWIIQQPASPALPPAVGSADSLNIPAGESLILQLETPLHTRTTKKGEHVILKTARDIRVGGDVAIPRGSEVRATVTKAKRAGRIRGRALIRLRLDEIRLAGGKTFPLKATIVRAGLTSVEDTKDGAPSIKGEKGGGGNVRVVAQGGLQGAVLGTLVKGGKGALYGSAVGAGIGLASIMLKRGPDLDLPRKTLFEARMDQSLSVPKPVNRHTTQIAAAGPTSKSSRPLQPPRWSNRKTPAESRTTTTDADGGRKAEETPRAGAPPRTDSNQTAAEDNESVEARPTDGTFQTLDPKAFRIKVDVKLVLVDAVVRDRNGRLMDHLRREDFRLYENGVEQTILTFSRDELPLAVALVVDRSGSVAPYMGALRAAANRTLMQLKPEDEVALFAFAGHVDRLEDLTTDRRRIADGIAGIRAGGGTNIIDGLYSAVHYLAMVAPDRRRAVILVSDNQATTSPRIKEGRLIELALETETVVYGIKTPGDALPLTLRLPNWIGGKGSVRKVTRETGGEIIDVAGSGSLDAALAAVISRLKLRYTLGYSPSQPSHDRAFRDIDVRLVDQRGRPGRDYSVSARRGYYGAGPLRVNSNP